MIWQAIWHMTVRRALAISHDDSVTALLKAGWWCGIRSEERKPCWVSTALNAVVSVVENVSYNCFQLEAVDML